MCLALRSQSKLAPVLKVFMFDVLFRFFFFQAEDGIRDLIVTGVQTCALPISSRRRHTRSDRDRKSTRLNSSHDQISYAVFCLRSEEHTSELQSRSDLVCRLLLEKKIASNFQPAACRIGIVLTASFQSTLGPSH